MRIAAFVGSVLLASLATLGGIVALVLLSHGRAADLMGLAIVALMGIVYGPLLIGSLRSYWDVRASPDSRRYFRRWFGGLYALQVLGLVAIVVYAVLAPASALLPIGYALLGVLLDVSASVAGDALLRRDEARRPSSPVWEPVTRQQIVRKILAVVITFVVILVGASVGLTLLLQSTSHGRDKAPDTGILFAAEFAFMGAALACIVASLQLNQQLREQVGRDVGLLRRIAKVVLRRKPIALEDCEQVAAAKYAALIALTLPFTLVYVLLLYTGLGMQQLSMLQEHQSGLFSIAYLVLLAAVLAWGIPVYLVRIRRARAYAAAHRDLLPAGGHPKAGEA